MRNPRRAYDREGQEIEPMSLGNMRQHRVRSVDATCEACRHEAAINVDSLADHIYVPDVASRRAALRAARRKLSCVPTGLSTSRLARAVIPRR